MNNKMLPNGGFPPITPCIEKMQVKDDNQKDKGFFYSTKTNNLNIRNILTKTKNKSNFIDINKEEDDLEIVDSI